jgi:hypothetical protein
VNKPKLLLLDADVIVFAHQLGTWEKLKKAYDIHVPATVIEIEVKYFRSARGQQAIDLRAELAAGNIKKLEATAIDVAMVFSNFDASFLASLHDGEKEAIAILISRSDPELIFCTGDVVAIQAVAMLGATDRCVSFEELLEKAGLRKSADGLQPNLTKKTHEHHSKTGSARRITAECFKKSPLL